MNERTIKVIGETTHQKLQKSRIAVFGLGGVGGASVEALARLGVGSLDVFDGDEFTESNLNRQILANINTIRQRKAEVAKQRIHAINPECTVNARDLFITLDNVNEIDFYDYDYVVDAIDNVTAKIAMICICDALNVPIISCMGTGNKLEPLRFRISDIYKTSVCPLARVMRRELKNRRIKHLDVLWSDEQPVVNNNPPGSVSFVPPVAGMLLVAHVFKKFAIY